jgi:hypothetical protein
MCWGSAPLELTASDLPIAGWNSGLLAWPISGSQKSPEETFESGRGSDIALADMVRVIALPFVRRCWSRDSQGTSRDGHRHHEAAGILTVRRFMRQPMLIDFQSRSKKAFYPGRRRSYT